MLLRRLRSRGPYLPDTCASLTVRGKSALKAREKRTTKPERENLRKAPSTAKGQKHQDR